MAADRIVLVESAARLSVDHGRIKIAREGEPDRFVAPADVAVVCLDHYATEITKQALVHLAEAAAAVMITDGSHLPAAMMLPLQGHGTMAERIHRQVAFSATDGPARLWQQIVTAKIRTQARTLRHFGCRGALRLERLAGRVQIGDAGNAEAQAAKHYWAHLFPDGFQREKQNAQHPVNQKLNYGYAVLRALIARQIAMAGLCPALGLGHKSSENPFNLADDFIEPYRFVVEQKVKAELSPAEPLGREERHRLLAILQTELRMKGQDYRLTAAAEETIESFCRCVSGSGSLQLTLPE
jgi:CRISPR-associated protein Cas1